ncbi:MAG: hypothetical protein LBD52_09230 [Prevotellaceae bacterium]|jgi:hypothetical protein|nr:hypothetical protein [Prevotellaceae bacterium]
MNKFLTFFDPFFAYIDAGKIFRKPFSWLYGFIAILNALFPFFLLYWFIGFFDSLGGQQIFGMILLWLVFLAAGWFSFQLWWNRMTKVATLTSNNDEFIVTPLYAHLLQTFGEWLGGYVAIVGALSALFLWIFIDPSVISNLFHYVGGGAVFGFGIAGILIAPIYGFLILISFRFLAEIAKALASIANNTKK